MTAAGPFQEKQNHGEPISGKDWLKLRSQAHDLYGPNGGAVG